MPNRSANDFEQTLSELMKVPVSVTFGRSRSTPIQVRWNGSQPLVRFHHMFAEAPPQIVDAIVAWLQHGRRARRACRELDAWIQATLEQMPAAPRRQVKTTSRGNTHNLEELVSQLTEGTLAGEFEDDNPAIPRLTWGRRAKSRSRHTLQLGSYSPELHLIRIHPVLDQDAVPAWLVSYVLFHELLHALIPAKKVGPKSWRHHCPEFRRRESEYVDYQRALAWEKKNLPALIRSARSGKPITQPQAPRVNKALDRLQNLLFGA